MDTGTAIDDRNNSKADTLWDGSHLYVASGSDSASGIKLFRYSYNPACRAWSLDTGFPVDLPGTGTRVEAVVLDRDAAGRLWITYTKEGSGIEDGKVYVSHSTTSDNTWIAPYELPEAGASNIQADDISALVAYNGHIGVMWSNQNDSKMYFASHANGAGDAASDWTSRVVLEGDGWADDHINLKSLEADPSGRVFAAVKTSLGDDPFNGTNADQIVLLVLQPDGTEDQVVPFGIVADDHTRPIVVTRQQTDELYVFATSPTVATDGDRPSTTRRRASATRRSPRGWGRPSSIDPGATSTTPPRRSRT